MNDYERNLLIDHAWRMASDDAKSKYDFWCSDNCENQMSESEWIQRQIDWMMSDPEWSELIMLARLGAEVKYRA